MSEAVVIDRGLTPEGARVRERTEMGEAETVALILPRTDSVRLYVGRRGEEQPVGMGEAIDLTSDGALHVAGLLTEYANRLRKRGS